MDKSKALERLNALESEAKELRKIIEAPEQPSSLLTKPVPGSGVRYWSLLSDAYEKLRSYDRKAKFENPDYYTHGNLFQSEELAQAYAEAIDTMLLLRHQPGTVPATDRNQWNIVTKGRGTSCCVDDDDNKFSKMYQISPCFATGVAANAAIKTVGEERILRMFKTLHHIS